MPTARKPRSTSTSNVSRARRTTARTAVVAPLSSSLNARLGARTEFRIYPSIGIARVGDCKDSFHDRSRGARRSAIRTFPRRR